MPKRFPSAIIDPATSPSKKVKARPATSSKSTPTGEEEVGPKAMGPQPTRNGDKIWKILGDERTHLVVGIAEPRHLTIRVQNRETNEIRTYEYSKLPNVINTIDFSDITHIRSIMKWRNQVFQRLQFPILHTITRWTGEEVMFLTLVYEKFVLAVRENRAISLPDNSVVYSLFVQEFGETHTRGAVNSRLRRKDGSRLSVLKEHFEGKDAELRPTGGSLLQLTIAEGELQAYIDKGYVRTEFEASTYRSWLDRGSLERGEPAEEDTGDLGEMSSPESPPGVMHSPDVHNLPSKLSASEPQAEESFVRGEPLQDSARTYDPVAARNAWLSVIVGPSDVLERPADHLPPFASAQTPQPIEHDSDEGISNASNNVTSSTTPSNDWLGQATNDFHTRIKKFSSKLASEPDTCSTPRGLWWQDRKKKNTRVEGAAAVNALLNAAIVPPVGYTGEICALVDDELLPVDQLRLHQASKVARRTFQSAHDEEYEESFD